MRGPDLTDALYEYIVAMGTRESAVQRALRAETAKLPEAQMQIGPEQAALLQVLVRILGAKRCIEVGTFTGYSALAVALALPPGGEVICCDVSAQWTAIGRRYWKKAGVERKIDLRLGPALETLKALRGRFDFAFIDADKPNYWSYYERCLHLLRKGGLVAVDNTLWGVRRRPAEAERKHRSAAGLQQAARQGRTRGHRVAADRRRPDPRGKALVSRG